MGPPSATFVDGPLLSVQSLNVSGALHVGQINVEAKLTAMQAQIDALTALVAELSGRVTAAEQLNGSPPSPLVIAVNSQAAMLSSHGTRLSAAENLNGTATPLTNTVKQMRDLTTGTPLYAAVDGLRTLAAGTALTDTVLGLRDMSAAGGTLVATVKAIRDFTPTAYAGYTTLHGLTSLTAGTALTDAVIGMRDMSVNTSTIVSTLMSVRDFTPGTALYTTVTGYNTRLTAVETLSGTPTSTLYTTVTGQSTTLTEYGTRLSAAENLNGFPTTLTDTVKLVRDLTNGTALFTVSANGTLGLSDGSSGAANPGSVTLNATAGVINLRLTTSNDAGYNWGLNTGTNGYVRASFWLYTSEFTSAHSGVQFTLVSSGSYPTQSCGAFPCSGKYKPGREGVFLVTQQEAVTGVGTLVTLTIASGMVFPGEIITYFFRII
jgi:hypothetical protein